MFLECGTGFACRCRSRHIVEACGANEYVERETGLIQTLKIISFQDMGERKERGLIQKGGMETRKISFIRAKKVCSNREAE